MPIKAIPNNTYFMLGFISKLFGGSKSEKDVKKIEPMSENQPVF